MAEPRREFLKQAGFGVAGTAALLATQSLQAAGANDKLVFGAIGCGGQGSAIARSFAGQPDCRVAYVCDPDRARAEKLAAEIKEIQGAQPEIVADLRKILDDKSVDAVTIGTPDHWHAPAAILACAAGKHVYVEKPCSHNVREGRLMIEAARKANRVVQVGTQSRSAAHVRKAAEALRSGAIGDVLVAKAWNSQRRGSIGHAAPSEPPSGFDYDLWVGPAPMTPFQPNRHHYGWHWWFAFGTGDMGNDGVHDIDIARFGLGVETHPTTITAIGGKYAYDDDQQFPDTQYVLFEYPGAGGVGQRRQLIYEQRLWSNYKQEGFENGNAFYGTNGMMLLGKKEGWKLFGPKNQLIDSMEPESLGLPHHRNFIECVRSGAKPNADIEINHLSTALCHLGNLACRVGRRLEFDPQTEQFRGDDEANALLRREYREGHWAVPRGV